MSRFRSEISLSGPFFTHDPVATFQDNLRTLIGEAAKVGARDVVGRMRRREGEPIRELSGVHVADLVEGRIQSLTGRDWHQTAIVSVHPKGSAKEAISIMAAASVKEHQTHAFRQMSSRMRSASAVNVNELMKGLS